MLPYAILTLAIVLVILMLMVVTYMVTEISKLKAAIHLMLAGRREEIRQVGRQDSQTQVSMDQ